MRHSYGAGECAPIFFSSCEKKTAAPREKKSRLSAGGFRRCGDALTTLRWRGADLWIFAECVVPYFV